MSVGQSFRERVEHDPMLAQLVSVMEGLLYRSDISPHDLARAAVLAAERHAMNRSSPVQIVLRDEEDGGPREWIVTEDDLQRVVRSARELDPNLRRPFPKDQPT